MMENFHVFENKQALAESAAHYILLKINACLEIQPRCRVALPGGSTPALCLQLLAKLDVPWGRVDWYLGDERCLPVGDAERNDSMINEQLFSHGLISNAHFYPIKAELGADRAAADYALLFDDFAALDIVILGMGEDGHTASLFPHNPALDDKRAVVPVFNAPKPPPERVSLSLPTLSAADNRIILVAGKDKQAALAGVQAGEKLPVNCIGDSTWFVDKAAAG